MDPPDSPVSAAIYAQSGFSFYQIWNEAFTVKGAFDGVKSVKAVDDGKKEKEKGAGVVEEMAWPGTVVTLDPEEISGSMSYKGAKPLLPIDLIPSLC